ncbi:MAG TPA: FHA domain-containing protein [Chroococcales cyanobacterium]
MTSNPAQGRLPVLVNLSTGEQYTLSELSITLGRAPENHVVLADDGYASAEHARIFWSDGAWWIEDRMSSNGTHVNDQLLSAPHRLSPNDTIKVGRTLYKIQ